MFDRVQALALLLASCRILSGNDWLLRSLSRWAPFLRHKLRFFPSGSNISYRRAQIPSSRDILLHKYGLDRSVLHLSYFGYIDRGRGLEVLYAAVRALVDEGRDIKVLMIGAGGDMSSAYVEGLRQLISDMGLENRVIWTGYRTEPEVVEYLLCSEVCVLPYRRNTTGRSSLAAALSIGVPVITTANADVLFSLVDHHNVLLVPPDDPLGLKQAIDELITSPLIRAQIGSRGQELFEQEFSWAAIADRLLRVYGELQ